MPKNNIVSLEGEVVECCGGTLFKVKVVGESGQEMFSLCHPSGKMRQNSIKILLGDTVSIEVSDCDLTKGRIVRRK